MIRLALLVLSAALGPAVAADYFGPPAAVFFGTELEAPFLPVLPPASDIEIPDDLCDALASVPGTSSPAGWLAAPSSLVLRAPHGALIHELGLGRFPDQDGALTRELRGGASKDGRFAWHWQRVETKTDGPVEAPPRTSSVLVYLGAHGQILARLDGADAPEGLAPAALSGDGEVLLSARREDGAWAVTARSFTGRELAAVKKAHRLSALAVSEDGRRALVAWAGLDLPMMVTLFDLARGERLDIPAETLPAGPWTLSADGTLLAAGRPVKRRP
ncbi:MAG: hypothetical protein FD126_3284 [Elusimicrobia bacterium]|nr:MAG: hypothetical protein FD126_3284 [Elusimicrobiota bacterium]